MEFAQFFLQPGSQAITCLQQVNLGINLDHLGERASSLRPGDFVGLCRALCCRRCVIFRGLPLDSLCLRPLVPVGRQIYQTMLKLFSRPFPKRNCGGYPLFHKAPSLIGQLNLWKEVARAGVRRWHKTCQAVPRCERSNGATTSHRGCIDQVFQF